MLGVLINLSRLTNNQFPNLKFELREFCLRFNYQISTQIRTMTKKIEIQNRVCFDTIEFRIKIKTFNQL